MIYFDNAATTNHKPKCVIDAVNFELENSVNPGRSAHPMAIAGAIRQFEARESLEYLLGVPPHFNTIFTSNCTEALNLAIFGLLLERTEQVHVVTTVMEHNSVLRPLYQLQSRGLITLTTLKPQKNGIICPIDVEKSLQNNTALVAITHASNVTGAVNDIKSISKITKKAGVPLLVDGAQAVGHMIVSVETLGADLYAGAGHKGVHGIQGAGFLCFDSKIKLAPIKFGGTGMASDSVFSPLIAPEVYEAGTAAMPAIVALGAGAKWTGENLAAIEEKCNNLGNLLVTELKKIKNVVIYSNFGGGIISFNKGDMPAGELADRLSEQGFALRAGQHCAPLMHRHLGTSKGGTVRASIGFLNTEAEVLALVRAIGDLVV